MSSHGSEHHDSPRRTDHGVESEARLPDHVYRRRRLVALALAVLLVLLLLWGVVAGVRAVTGSGGDDAAQPAAEQPAPPAGTSSGLQQKFGDFTPRPDPSGSASSSGSPSAGPSASSSAAPECGADLTVTASTDKETYPAKQEPVLAMTLENTGEHPCRVNAGSKRMTFTVVSGADTVFDSRHCAAAGEDRNITLNAGQKETARLTWNRVRTAEGCPAGQAEALAGYYKLTASLGDTTSEPAAFVLE